MAKQEPFDLTTHVRDLRTGEIIEKRPYRLFDTKMHGEIFERPVGSGICYFRDGTRAPTIAEVKKINEAKLNAVPKPLTTADIKTLKDDVKKEYAEEIEKSVRAKAEAEFQSRLDDLVVERVSTIMQKMNIGPDQANEIVKQVAPTITVDEPTAAATQAAAGEPKPAWLKEKAEGESV